jgi:predicted flap endonuclease-1-like 5' DNA nuclease
LGKGEFFMLLLQMIWTLPAVSPLLQTVDRGTTPIWVIILLLFLVIALFWWGLNRPAYDQAVATESVHDDHHEAGSEPQVAVPTGAAAPPAPDDLKRIEGIGPKIERILQEAGIFTFAQLAAAEVSQLEKIVREDANLRIAFPASWPEQARLAAAGDWEALAKLQDGLRAGRESA